MRSSFWDGFTYWFRGWTWLWKAPGLGFYAVFPFLFAAAFFIGILSLITTHIGAWTTSMVVWAFPSGSVWVEILYYPLWFSLFLLTLLMSVYLSYVVHVLVCGPFYSLLAERALMKLGKLDDKPFSLKESLRQTWQMMRVAVLKLGLFLLLGLFIFLISFVPVLNVVGFTMAMMILAFDTMDYSFEALGWSLRQRLTYVRQHPGQWLGMTASLALTLFLPGLTLLVLPGAVAGAARLIRPQTPRQELVS